MTARPRAAPVCVRWHPDEWARIVRCAEALNHKPCAYVRQAAIDLAARLAHVHPPVVPALPQGRPIRAGTARITCLRFAPHERTQVARAARAAQLGLIPFVRGAALKDSLAHDPEPA